MKVYKNPSQNKWAEMSTRPTVELSELYETVQEIFSTVAIDGDEALKFYTSKFDHTTLQSIQISKSEIENAAKNIPANLKNSIKIAKQNIEAFHKSQVNKEPIIETVAGIKCWRETRAIDKVGLYIPGGSAPLFSTLLMLGIPAKIAGCKEIILCTPPTNGQINPTVLYTASLLGINKIYAVGGAQAIAAMSFGTKTVPAVYKIFGPGNQYVTAAKMLAQNMGIAIDMPAGPSEALVIADKEANPSFVASDLIAQAEHGTDSQVILLSNDEAFVKTVLVEIKNQTKVLPRKMTIEAALKNSKAIIFKDIETCFSFNNTYAPEHLLVQVASPKKYISLIQNAGSVFFGTYSCESIGDYASGTNHTLPTNGFAKAYSGVSVDSFVKKITFQEISKTGLLNIGPTVETMAAAEGLEGHKNAVSIRLNKINKK
jgi:histidinol dehydrogenase